MRVYAGRIIKEILHLMTFRYKLRKDLVPYGRPPQHHGAATLNRIAAVGAKPQMIHLIGHDTEAVLGLLELGLAAITLWEIVSV